jgi:sugar-specific transcriptional regulator TrmB
MKKENSIKPLVELGFTDLESEIYTFLVENSPATGYRIANKINKPTANTYKALRSLVSRGIAIEENSTPQSFRSIPIAMLLDRLESRFQKMKSLAAFELSNLKPAEDDEKVYRLHTVDQVYERFREMLKRCKKIALMNLFPVAVAELKGDIEATAARGINVLLKLYQPAEIQGCFIGVEPTGSEVMSRWPGIGANGIVDGREHLIAFLSSDNSRVHDAIWSKNIIISANFHSALFSEIMLCAFSEILKRDDVKLPEKYVQMYAIKSQEVPGYSILMKRYQREQVHFDQDR